MISLRLVQKWERSVTVESFEKVLKNGTISHLGGLEELTGLTRTGTSTGKLTETGNLLFFLACVAMFVAARIVCLERGHSMTMNHSVVLLPITSAKNNNTDCLTLLSKGDHKKHSPKQ